MELENIVVLKLNDNFKSPVLPKELEPEVVKRIGSEFKKGTNDCIRGLNPLQERVFLPEIIGLGAEAVEFPRRVKDYWAEFHVIPTKDGVRLNIATEIKTSLDKEGKSIEIETPVNLYDYMVYNFAKQSSKVATTREEIESENFLFTLIDLSEEEKLKRKSFDVKKDAIRELAKLTSEKADDTKINWVIRCLKEVDEYFDFSQEREKKEMYLMDKMETSPSTFVSTAKDKDLETKALLFEAIEAKEITIEGPYYFFGTINMGTEKAALDWLRSPSNSESILTLKARLENSNLIQKQ